MCLNPGDILQNRYQIIDRLGCGGFAITYRANDLRSPANPPCVVKEILPPQSNDARVRPRAQELFEREANSLELLGHHSQITAFIDHFQENQKFYIVQQYIDGHPLRDELIPDRRWSEAEVAELLREILEILQFVHHHGVIHRDVTPSNLIRRNSDQKIVLIDFGAVKEIGTLQITRSGHTRTTTIGTPGYAPPEQLNGHPRFCSDIYAAGIIGIQAIAGLHIDDFFHDRRTGEIVWRYSVNNLPIVQISDGMINILDNMVRYHFNDRYQSAADVLKDLRSLVTPLQLTPPLSPKPALHKPGRKSPNRWKIWLFVASALSVGIAAFVIHHLFQPKTCASIQGDAVSCGEEILIKTSVSRFKERGKTEFFDKNYQSAFDLFKQSWNEEERKDPETLIYMNNALLQAKKADYYTIAVAVPINNSETGAIDADLLAKEILRGIAHAQTEVNLEIFKAERDFPGQDFLAGKAINGKGLRVIIADDANLEAEAKARANSLVKQTEILGVVGHYTNEMTVSTVDIYDPNHLVLISPGSTTEELTEKQRKFFFRTVQGNQINARVFTKYLIEKAGQKKAAGFYCPDIKTSFSFWEEFRKEFKKAGGNIVSISEFDLCKKDFNVEKALQEVQRSEKTAIVLSASHFPDATKNAMALIKANGDRNWVVGTGGIYSQKTLETASALPSFEKLLASSFWHPLAAPNRTFADRALKLWGGNVNHRTALTYDATRTLIKAIENQQQPSREGMQKTIASPNFSATGATGTIQFDAKGDRKNFRPGLVRIVKCQKEQFGVTFVPIKYATATEAGLKCDRSGF
jgi:eukaryotic-like serine/threonine-protein kinase